MDSSTDAPAPPLILPFTRIIGQETLVRALEISYVAPAVGGVLATGQRGTAKSTAVRAFARMVTGRLPVTMPIAATEDRVIGGWHVDRLIEGRAEWQPGLIEEAGRESGMLYIDEVNLLEDHLVNIILDAASSGILTIQRDGRSTDVPVRFNLVGTMNPEEGGVRPQLLDRFGLVVWVESMTGSADRARILRTVLEFEDQVAELGDDDPAMLYTGDAERHTQLDEARKRLADVGIPSGIFALIGTITDRFRIEGHRGEIALLRAAQALAAIEREPRILPRHLADVAPLALMHRRATSESGTLRPWSEEDDRILDDCLRYGRA
jgi:magnesium chelatase subunit I